VAVVGRGETTFDERLRLDVEHGADVTSDGPRIMLMTAAAVFKRWGLTASPGALQPQHGRRWRHRPGLTGASGPDTVRSGRLTGPDRRPEPAPTAPTPTVAGRGGDLRRSSTQPGRASSQAPDARPFAGRVDRAPETRRRWRRRTPARRPGRRRPVRRRTARSYAPARGTSRYVRTKLTSTRPAQTASPPTRPAGATDRVGAIGGSSDVAPGTDDRCRSLIRSNRGSDVAKATDRPASLGCTSKRPAAVRTGRASGRRCPGADVQVTECRWPMPRSRWTGG
jgi:hypothetical protein